MRLIFAGAIPHGKQLLGDTAYLNDPAQGLQAIMRLAEEMLPTLNHMSFMCDVGTPQDVIPDPPASFNEFDRLFLSNWPMVMIESSPTNAGTIGLSHLYQGMQLQTLVSGITPSEHLCWPSFQLRDSKDNESVLVTGLQPSTMLTPQKLYGLCDLSLSHQAYEIVGDKLAGKGLEVQIEIVESDTAIYNAGPPESDELPFGVKVRVRGRGDDFGVGHDFAQALKQSFPMTNIFYLPMNELARVVNVNHAWDWVKCRVKKL